MKLRKAIEEGEERLSTASSLGHPVAHVPPETLKELLRGAFLLYGMKGIDGTASVVHTIVRKRNKRLETLCGMSAFSFWAKADDEPITCKTCLSFLETYKDRPEVDDDQSS